jgi:uncharacterized protein YndB with AHSA1/START domain
MADANPAPANTAGRDNITTRLFDAPRSVVFEMWTDPAHIAHWWGPNGFTTTIHEMDVRPGGQWRLIMHGPNGVDYPNHNVFVEVVKPQRLVFDHASAPRFRATVTFEDRAGKTQVTLRQTFETAEFRDKVNKEFGAVEGARQTFGRLNDYLMKWNPRV